MKLHVLFGQRRGSTPDEYAPEALEIADEYTMDDNSAWMEKKLEDHAKSNDFAALKVIVIDLGAGATGKIQEILIGTPILQGKLS